MSSVYIDHKKAEESIILRFILESQNNLVRVSENIPNMYVFSCVAPLTEADILKLPEFFRKNPSAGLQISHSYSYSYFPDNDERREYDDKPIVASTVLSKTVTKALCEFLKTNTTIKLFELKNPNDWPAEDQTCIMNALKENKSITELKINPDYYHSKEMPMVVETLSKYKKLELKSSYFREEFAKLFFKTLETNTKIIDLDLTGVGLDCCVDFLAEAIRKNKTLQTLVLRFNWLDPKKSVIIAKALAQNTSLTCLSFHDQMFITDGIEALANGLNNNPKTKLETLVITTTCNIGEPKGMEAFFRFLANNKTLKKVDISNNYLSPKATDELGKALQTNSTLTTLIAKNCEGCVCSESLEDAMEQNSTLSEFEFPQERGAKLYAVIQKKCAENKAKANPTASTIITVISNTASASAIAVPSKPVLLSAQTQKAVIRLNTQKCIDEINVMILKPQSAENKQALRQFFEKLLPSDTLIDKLIVIVKELTKDKKIFYHQIVNDYIKKHDPGARMHNYKF